MANPENAQFRPVIEDNFETSGPYIGRVKNTELGVDLATAELILRDNLDYSKSNPTRYTDRWLYKKFRNDLAFYTSRLIWEQDPDYQEAATKHKAAWDQDGEEDDIEKAFATDDELSEAGSIVENDYQRLQIAKADHDAELLAQARDQEADRYEAIR